MKLSKNQKAFLKTIKNDKAMAEQKTQFKLQNKFDRKGVEIIFTDGQFKTDDPRFIEFLNSTPMFCNKVDVATQITQEELEKKVDNIKWFNIHFPPTEKSLDKKLDELNWIKIDTAKGAIRREPINLEKRWKEKCLEMDKIIDESELKEKTKEESKSDFDTMQWGDRKEPETLTKEALRDLTEPKVVENAQVKEESVAKKVIAERLQTVKISDLLQTPLTPDKCIKPTETIEPKTYSLEDMEKSFLAGRIVSTRIMNGIKSHDYSFIDCIKSLK